MLRKFKHKAEDWIFKNTPCISLAELVKIYVTAKRSSNSEYNKRYRNKLKALAKSKIKK